MLTRQMRRVCHTSSHQAVRRIACCCLLVSARCPAVALSAEGPIGQWREGEEAAVARLVHLSLQLEAIRCLVKTRLIDRDSVCVQQRQTVCLPDSLSTRLCVCVCVYVCLSGTRRRKARRNQPDTLVSPSVGFL